MIRTPVLVLDNETLTPIWDSQHPMKVTVRESKRVTGFTVEDGTIRNDHIVDDPVEIEIQFVITDELQSQFSELQQTFNDRQLVTIQTKSAVYSSMVVSEVPQEQDNERADAITVNVRFSQWREIAPEFGTLTMQDVDRAEQSDTVNRGSQSTRGSVLSRVF